MQYEVPARPPAEDILNIRFMVSYGNFGSANPGKWDANFHKFHELWSLMCPPTYPGIANKFSNCRFTGKALHFLAAKSPQKPPPERWIFFVHCVGPLFAINGVINHVRNR